MGDNQTSSEDSGQHSSVVISKHENTSENTKTTNKIQLQSEHRTRSGTVDPKPPNKFKPTQRRNTIQNAQGIPTSSPSSNFRKTSLSKMNSLTHGDDINDSHDTMATTSSVSNDSVGKHCPNNVIARTTSESLRLNTMPTITNDIHSLSNTTSHSSLARQSYSSNSSSNPPRSTQNSSDPTTTSSSPFSAKMLSQNNNNNNNNNVYNSDVGSPHVSRTHHSQGHSYNSQATTATLLPRKPKTTSSFQITSVTVGQGKKSSDNGEESADDLDESHTEENSNSRTIDMETDLASMSEDTFSKDEVFYANSALSSTAPAIPTSAQYGLIVVDPAGPNQANLAENIINVVSAAVTPGGSKKKEDIKDTQHRSERFKVVKIESTEPFRRGRWMCMDYLDHSTVGNGGKEGNNNNSEKNDTSGGCIGEHSKTTQSMIIGTGAATLLDNNAESMSNVKMTDSNWNYPNNTTAMGVEGTSPSHQQLNQHILGSSGIATAPATMAPGMPQTQSFLNTIEQDQLQRNQQDNVVNENDTSNSNEPSVEFAIAAAQQLQKSLQQLKQQEDAIAAVEAAAQIFGPSETQQMNYTSSQNMAQHQQKTTTTNETPNITNPTSAIPNNLNFQNSVALAADSNQTSPSSHHTSQTEFQLAGQEQTHQNKQSLLDQTQLANHQMTYAEVAQQNSQQQQHFQTKNPNTSVSYVQPTQQQNAAPTHSIYEDINTQPQQQQQQAHMTTAPSTIVIPPNLHPQMSQTDGTQPSSLLQSTQFPQNVQGQTLPMMAQVQQTATMQQSAPATLADGNALIASLQAVQRQQQGTGLENLMGQMTTVATGVTSADFSQQNITKNMGINGNINNIANVMNMIRANTITSSTVADDLTQQQLSLQPNMVSETESASGTSSVAIDNKIEQAMDLVKSHLMIAVREEVEVLKEKISELMDKINQLEVENTILKANMSQETLQQLQMQTQLQISGNTNTSASVSNVNNTNTAATPTANGNSRDTSGVDIGTTISASTPSSATAENIVSSASNTTEAESASNINGIMS